MSKSNYKLSRDEARKEIEKFFKELKEKKDKTPKDIKKIKKISMKNKIPLKEKRKLFCKKCLMPYGEGENEKVRINNGKKSITCSNCGYTARWNLK